MKPLLIEDRDTHVYVMCHGPWPPRGRLAAMQSACPRHWRAGGAALLDVRGIVMKTADDYLRLNEQFHRWAQECVAVPRIAVLGAPGLSYGIARMIASNWADERRLAAFDSEPPALDWLLSAACVTANGVWPAPTGSISPWRALQTRA